MVVFWLGVGDRRKVGFVGWKGVVSGGWAERGFVHVGCFVEVGRFRRCVVFFQRLCVGWLVSCFGFWDSFRWFVDRLWIWF